MAFITSIEIYKCTESNILIQIDDVGPPYYQATTLFLSNNEINDISGLAQFPKLKTLSLANNHVRSIL